MKLGSHNSLSYRNSVWYQRLIHFAGKCQSANYKEQYEKYGVRLFDLRIWFNDSYNIEVRHGIIKFNITENEIYEFLAYLNKKEDCYVRIIFEETNLNKVVVDEYRSISCSSSFLKLNNRFQSNFLFPPKNFIFVYIR